MFAAFGGGKSAARYEGTGIWRDFSWGLARDSCNHPRASHGWDRSEKSACVRVLSGGSQLLRQPTLDDLAAIHH